ncbi:LysM peptidoglycan-binding domain-containing protein [Derxia gummosa]|uniref:LysM peptidoglycan-binding domain-containing protein n=1 Tax=Derxia gummosa DSM 723 TaxID=1121388 RepID=A0A8B6X392_9BURK|nr:LysM peptidoglycan-binding domain-containing protein [Derxia gummosa]
MPDASAAQGGKQLLTIQRCKLETDGSVTVVESDAFSALINPAKLTRSASISYTNDMPEGAIGNELKFKGYGNESLKFDLVFDGTGVIEGSAGKTVDGMVKALDKIVYDYDGDAHEPSRVQIVWGTTVFKGRLTSRSVDYTLFAPDGTPLRCKLSLGFDGFVSPQEAAVTANKSSPDLTHLVTVREGDTLPLLCYRIYRHAGYYPQVARVNGLDSVRRLKAGTVLRFPPLE